MHFLVKFDCLGSDVHPVYVREQSMTCSQNVEFSFGLYGTQNANNNLHSGNRSVDVHNITYSQMYEIISLIGLQFFTFASAAGD
eukprot:m.104522 g.104522  ORF g.104522 m.104522 type:complete len:84 (+) comp16852_c0_seq2:59-310(+)